MEIERKFLVKNDTWKEGVKTFHKLEQGYLAFAGDNKEPEVRIRLASRPFRKDNNDEDGNPFVQEYSHAFLTVKSKGDMVRSEVESVIDLDAAKEMMKSCMGTVVSKTRYLVPCGEVVFEVDVYHGPLEGLVTAEVELSSIHQDISIPSWVGEDITSIGSYKNASLAKHGMPAHRIPASPSP